MTFPWLVDHFQTEDAILLFADFKPVFSVLFKSNSHMCHAIDMLLFYSIQLSYMHLNAT